ncbi:MAG: siphovirus ReqiPepy6 Gp37-like family protein, partial [Actinobacteria bacterium]|nr:siphovirus ReqiPepy6 Gp37-like family protein [Actinomycetota bacterium]
VFDGEVNENSEFTYGVDYDVGDLVEMRNKDGIITYKRVLEQIFVSDSEGERAYPTLALDMFAGENTWLSWTNKTQVWEDFTTEFWEDM